MAVQVYNTLTQRKEPFQPREAGIVRMYVCGPTVYDQAHIGHAMSAIVFDVIRRYLEYRGYTVIFVQNFTDIDDKIINRARDRGENWADLAQRYIDEFLDEMRELGVKPATIYPRATQELDYMFAMIEGLIERGYAYVADGDVYYRVTRKSDYGKLSNRSVDEMLAGARVDVDERKEHPMDFALWKAAKPGEPAWESPWGPGRPGWHIECSAMCLHHLGEQVDIHGGGRDLVFPHHENEIAQSEAYLGREPFARYWLHNGLLLVNGEKMSKSLGNYITTRDLLDRGDGIAYRYFVLTSHYRKPINFTDADFDAAKRGLERLRAAVVDRRVMTEQRNEAAEADLAREVETASSRFIEAMDDDFNTPGGLAALHDLARAINRAADSGASAAAVAAAQASLREMTDVFGLDLAALPAPSAADHAVEPLIQLLITVRADLRQARQWTLADRIRDGLAEQGIALEDTPSGTTYRIERP